MYERTVAWEFPGGSLSLTPNDGSAPAAPTSITSEIANQWTHGVGFLLSVVAAWIMLSSVAGHPDPWRVVGCLVYVCSQMAVYGVSTLSHSVREPRRLALFQMLDQVCILLMIAGTYTPFGLVHARTGGWWLLLAAMWGLVLAGIYHRVVYGPGSVAYRFFAAIGWMPVLALGQVYVLSGLPGLGLVLGGGLAYTVGIWFLVNDYRHPYLHAVWHLCTIAGSTCHFLFLQQYVALWGLA